jgi:predicted nucleic acid-binding Zn ribbon protein
MMLASELKNNSVLKSIDRACRYARELEEREKRDRRYGMLFFLLAVLVAGLVDLLIRRFA